MRLIWAPVLVLGAALVLSACGGDDSPEQPIVIPTTDTTSSSLSKDEYIEEGDAVCEEANAAIAQYAAAGQGLTEADEIAALRQGIVTELNDLGPPDDDRTTLDQVLAGFEAQVEAGEKIALASDRGNDTAEFETELDAAQAETLAAAETYGFTVCGQEPSGSASPTDGTSVAPGDSAAPVAPAEPAPESDAGGVGDTGGDTGDDGGGGGGGVSPGGGVAPD